MVRNEEELLTLEATAEAVKTVFMVGFALTFILNLLLNGAMSQLWSVFNTLQIILAMPLLAVIMPANVLLVQRVVNEVINFQVVEKQTLKETIYEPIFGSINQNFSSLSKEEDESLLLSMLMLLLGLAVLLLLIALLTFCKRKVLPRCCSCFQKLVNMVMAKLMFNSILRALMQTYLQTTLAMWISLRATNLTVTTGQVDFALFFLTIAFAVSFIVLSYKFLKRNHDNMRIPQFKSRFDSLYQNLDYYKKKALLNTSFFLLRRILFAGVIVFCEDSLVAQVILSDVLCTLLLIYLIFSRAENHQKSGQTR